MKTFETYFGYRDYVSPIEVVKIFCKNLDDCHKGELARWLDKTRYSHETKLEFLVSCVGTYGLASISNFEYLDKEFPHMFAFDYPSGIFEGGAFLGIEDLTNEDVDRLSLVFRDAMSYPLLDEDDYNARVNNLRDEYARMYKGDFEPYTLEEVRDALDAVADELDGYLDFSEEDVREYLELNYGKREVIA